MKKPLSFDKDVVVDSKTQHEYLSGVVTRYRLRHVPTQLIAVAVGGSHSAFVKAYTTLQDRVERRYEQIAEAKRWPAPGIERITKADKVAVHYVDSLADMAELLKVGYLHPIEPWHSPWRSLGDSRANPNHVFGKFGGRAQVAYSYDDFRTFESEHWLSEQPDHSAISKGPVPSVGKPTEMQLAMHDAFVFGTGYMVDGKRIEPSRIEMVYRQF